MKAAEAKLAEAEKELQTRPIRRWSPSANIRRRHRPAPGTPRRPPRTPPSRSSELNSKGAADRRREGQGRSRRSEDLHKSERFAATKNPSSASRAAGRPRPGKHGPVHQPRPADHLTPGITFEVYDKTEGIPALGRTPTSNNRLPAGKASIEIVRVGQNSSECRVVHSRGRHHVQGDVMPTWSTTSNRKLQFYVYGEFDVDTTALDTARGRRRQDSLITRWGGTIDDRATVDIDFVIRPEPQMPVYFQGRARAADEQGEGRRGQGRPDQYNTRSNEAAISTSRS